MIILASLHLHLCLHLHLQLHLHLHLHLTHHVQVGGLIWEGSVWKGVLAAHANWAFKLSPVLV